MKKRTGLIVIVMIFSLSLSVAAAVGGKKGKAQKEEVAFQGGEIGLALGLRGMEFLVGEGSPISMLEIWTTVNIYVMPELFLAPEVMAMYVERKDEDGSQKGTTTSWKVGAGLGLYYQFNVGGNVFIYSGPRFVFKYNWYKNEENDGTEDNRNTMDIMTLAIVGGRFMVGPSFGIFADFGLGFTFRQMDRDYTDNLGIKTDDYREKYISLHTYKGQVGVVYFF